MWQKIILSYSGICACTSNIGTFTVGGAKGHGVASSISLLTFKNM